MKTGVQIAALQACRRCDDAFIDGRAGMAFGARCIAFLEDLSSSPIRVVVYAPREPAPAWAGSWGTDVAQVLASTSRQGDALLAFGSRTLAWARRALPQREGGPVVMNSALEPVDPARLELAVLFMDEDLDKDPRWCEFIAAHADVLIVAGDDPPARQRRLAAAKTAVSACIDAVVELVDPPVAVNGQACAAADLRLLLDALGERVAESACQLRAWNMMEAARRLLVAEGERIAALLALRDQAAGARGMPASGGRDADPMVQLRVAARHASDDTIEALSRKLDLDSFAFRPEVPIAGITRSEMQCMRVDEAGRITDHAPVGHSPPWFVNQPVRFSLAQSRLDAIAQSLRDDADKRYARDLRSIERLVSMLESDVRTWVASIEPLATAAAPLSLPRPRPPGAGESGSANAARDIAFDIVEKGVIPSVFSHLRAGQSLARGIFGLAGMLIVTGAGVFALMHNQDGTAVLAAPAGGGNGQDWLAMVRKSAGVVLIGAIGYAMYRFSRARPDQDARIDEAFGKVIARLVLAVETAQRTLSVERAQAHRKYLQTVRQAFDRYLGDLDEQVRAHQAAGAADEQRRQREGAMAGAVLKDKAARLQAAAQQLVQAQGAVQRAREQVRTTLAAALQSLQAMRMPAAAADSARRAS